MMENESKKDEPSTDEAAPVDGLVIPFGEKVKITKRFKRVHTKGRRKEYLERDCVTNGVFLGLRTITNGYTDCSYDEGCYWLAEKHIRAALVATSPRQNPIYVPLDAIEV